MDELDHVLKTYRSRSTAPARWKLDVLMDLEPLRDARILPFLLEVLVDRREPSQVRIRVVKHLRESVRVAANRPSVAEALIGVMTDHSDTELRLAAVLALTEFANIAGVSYVLGEVARDTSAPLELRYCAFTSVERAGPRPEVGVLMRHLSTDPVLGSAARAVLTRWERG